MQINLRAPSPSIMTAPASTWATFSQIADRLLGPRGCLFTFHRAAPNALWKYLPNRRFYLDLDFLDRLLTYLSGQGWDIVTVEEAVNRIKSGRIDRKFVNFSVDDCYRDTYELVVPLFRRHRAPVTLFVTTGIPDATLPLVFAGLEDSLLTRGRIRLEGQWRELGSEADRRILFAQLARQWDGPQGPAKYADFCAANEIDLEALHWKHAISWQMLSELAADPFVEIGAHTISHARISSLTPERAEAEMTGSRQRLEEKLGLPIKHFAFPYGRADDCGPRDFQLALASGFTSASTTRKGLVGSKSRLGSLPRITLNGAHRSVAMAEAHLIGTTGVLANVLGRV